MLLYIWKAKCKDYTSWGQVIGGQWLLSEVQELRIDYVTPLPLCYGS